MSIVEIEYALAFQQYNDIRLKCLAGTWQDGTIDRRSLLEKRRVQNFVNDITRLLDETDWSTLTAYADKVYALLFFTNYIRSKGVLATNFLSDFKDKFLEPDIAFITAVRAEIASRAEFSDSVAMPDQKFLGNGFLTYSNAIGTSFMGLSTGGSVEEGEQIFAFTQQPVTSAHVTEAVSFFTRKLGEMDTILKKIESDVLPNLDTKRKSWVARLTPIADRLSKAYV